MNAVQNPSTLAACEPDGAEATRRVFAEAVVAAAVLYNFVLCFVNTNLFGISAGVVILAEVVLIGIAFVLIWDRSSGLLAVLAFMAAYFAAVMVLRSEFDPKIVRDLLIPIVFFSVGRYLGFPRSADRLVTLLIAVAFAVALFEWLAPGAYLRYFEVLRYYVARGTAETEADVSVYAGGFFNSARFESRTLLPFLGDHRVSGIFLEAPSVGNFGAITFAWVLLRDRQHFRALVAKSFAIVTLIVLADARFGLYCCLFTLVLYAATPVVRPTMLFIAPLLVIVALVSYAGINWQEAVSNTMLGRFILAGNILVTLNPLQVFGLQASDIRTGVRFAMDPVTDSGYAYILIKIGIAGMAAMWALFVYAPVHDGNEQRFKNFVALYYIVLLTISASVFTIKTAALLWFLYGVLGNPERAGRPSLSVEPGAAAPLDGMTQDRRPAL